MFEMPNPYARRSLEGEPVGTRAADPTRAKLLDAAGTVFAERGFHEATVREICARARANIAAVNYHFGDKLGLYTEVLRNAVRGDQFDRMRSVADQNLPPEEVLRRLIRFRLRSVSQGDRPAMLFPLMAHEFARPTPAMSRIVNEALRPMYDRLREIVGAILGLPRDHETTRLCTHSVIGQIVHYVVARPIVGRLWPELKMTPVQLDRIADHIADFSLAYLQTYTPQRGRAPSMPPRRRS
jgi:TetR/AcrR family transcriptional regulator, regulator of cefoperazone and chloramphenicol sensitivity